MAEKQEYIKLNEVLKIMDTGETFSMKFVTFDKSRKTGGHIRFVNEAKIPNKKNTPQTKSVSKNPKRQPNHWTNHTRPFVRLENGVQVVGVRRLHIFLLIEFNNKIVYL